jgi:hypothetical protein
MRFIIFQMLFLTFSLNLTSGCGRDHLSLRQSSGASLDASPAMVDEQSIALKLSQLSAERMRQVWQSAATLQIDEELLDAIVECQCAQILTTQLLRQNLKARGVLHQALMPTIRAEIRNDPDLASLLSLPNGIRDVVREIFAGDEEISRKIRESITSTLKSMWDDSDSAKLTSFTFDGLSPMFGDQSAEFISHPTQFKVQEQALRWRMIFRELADASKTSPPKPDQIIAIAKALSEWKYIFGIEKDESGESYGGLTLDAHNGDSQLLRSFDPRQEQDYVGYISGAFEVYYPTGESIDLATAVKEIWFYKKQPVRLVEQSMLWEAAAEAYLNLRPKARQTWDLSLSLSDSPIASEAHQLSLLFLKSLEVLLDGPLIDRERRLIRSNAKIGTGLVDDAPADVNELSHLVRALSKWAIAMKDVESDGLDDETTSNMKQGLEAIKEPLRLAVHQMMQKFDETSELSLQLKLVAVLAGVVREVLPSATLDHWLRARLPLIVQKLVTEIGSESPRMSSKSRESIIWLASLGADSPSDLLSEELTEALSKVRDLTESVLTDVYGQKTVRGSR